MSTQWLQYDALEAKMRGQSTLEGFDVLMSYSEGQLNQLLKTATANDTTTLIPVPEFVTAITGQWPNPAQTFYKVDLTMAQPNFAFAGPTNSAEVILSFSFKGTVCTSTAATGPWSAATAIPTGLELAITSQLSTVTGSVHPDHPGSRFVPATQPINASGDNSVSFNSDKKQQAAIVIYIPKETGSGGTVSITATGSSNEPSVVFFMNSLIKTNLEQYFQSQSWYYYIALVNNSSPAPGAYALQPTSFGFSVSAGNGADIDNAVCMWITVQGGSGASVLAPGQNCDANFSVQNTSTMPIPVGHGSTASIIFSHDLIQSLMFKQSLQDAGYTSVVSADSPGFAGMRLNFNFPSDKIDNPAVNYSHTDTNMGGATRTVRKVDAIDFDVAQYPATMTIAPGLAVAGTPNGTITWTTPTFNINWVSDVDTFTMSPVGGSWFGDDHSGTTDIVFALTGQGSWVNTSSANQDVISFSWSLPDSFDITATAEKKDLSWWQRLWSDWDNGVPADLRNLKFSVKAPSTQSSINYFLTTNLLLPGSQMFIPDPLVAASADVQRGISVPYDVLLTGTIAQNVSTVLAQSFETQGLTLLHQPRVVADNRAFKLRRAKLTHEWHRTNARNFARPVAPASGKTRENFTHSNGGNRLVYGARTVGVAQTKWTNGASHANGTNGYFKSSNNPPSSNMGKDDPLTGGSDKTLADFVSTVVKCAPDSMMGSLFAASALLSVDDAAAKTLAILQKNGFGNLTADQLYSVLGTSTELLHPTQQKTFGGFKVKTKPTKAMHLADALDVPAFDLRIFRGVYTVTDGPASATSQTLVVSPTDGTITFDNGTYYPTVTTDTTVVPYRNTVAWSTGVASYTAVFSSAPGAGGGAFVSSFSGMATPLNGTAQKFAGRQKQDPPPATPVDVAGIVGDILGFIGVIAFVAAVKWRMDDTDAEALLAPENERIRERYRVLDDWLQDQAKDKVDSLVEAHDIPWAEFSVGIQGRTTEALDDSLADMDYARITEALNNPTGADWTALIATADDAMSQAVTNSTLADGQPAVARNMQTWVDSGYINVGDVRGISGRAWDDTIQNKIAEIRQSSYIDSATVNRALKRRAELGGVRLEYLDNQVNSLTEARNQTNGELAQKAETLAGVNNQLDNADLEPDARTELESQRDGLTLDIDRLNSKKLQQDSDVTDALKNRSDMDQQNREDSDDGNAAETRADGALADGLRGVE